MPYASEIISKIDELVVASSLTDERFKNRYFAGLCQQIPTRSKVKDDSTIYIIPAKVTNLGEATQVIPDDNFNLITYHRLLSNTYSVAEINKQWGDGNNVQICTSDILLTVISFSSKISLSAEQLEALFIAGFPNDIGKLFAQSLQMFRVVAQVVSSNFDSVSIFSQEYRGQTIFLKPGQMMFQIRYRVESLFKKGCFNICDCD